jgi:CRP/FNR family transcriptional regulator
LTRKDIHNSETPILCLSCEARHKGICSTLSEEQLLFLAKHASKTVVHEKAALKAIENNEGQYANILSGVVKLSKLMSDGRYQIVGLQFAPDFLGRPFSERDSNTMVEACTEVRLCTFPKQIIENIISNSPEMERRLHQQTLKELDEAREWMLTLAKKTAQEKLASFLLLIAINHNPEEQIADAKIQITLPLKRADIADFLGLTIETVSRQLTNLRKKGIIELIDRKTILVPSFNTLKAIASANDFT